MLWRALGTLVKGNYIDVGAQDPVIDSVSLAFYQHGWRGWHVEPTRQYAETLRHARPDERVLQAAVGSKPGQLTFYEFADSGLSTGDETIAQAHIAKGFQPFTHTVDVVTLDDVLSQWDDTPVHWLKIDVEGMEGAVLDGWKTSTVRPWLLVIESHAPGSQRHAHEAWEPSLIAKGYQYIYTDGINRFYLSDQHPELASAFDYPPNVFDEFALSGQASNAFCNEVKHQIHLTEVRASKAEEQLYHANIELQKLDESQQQLIATQQTLAECLREANNERQATLVHHDQLQAQLQAQLNEQREQTEQLLNSRSWRITAPLRGATQTVKGWIRPSQHEQATQGHPLRANQRINRSLKWLAWQVAKRPRLKNAALSVLKRNPWLFERITRRLNQAVPPANGSRAALAYHQATLTARARKLHKTLSSAKEVRS